MMTKTDRNKNPVQIYLKQIEGINVLSREEEAHFARKAAKGDKAAKDKLITSNLRFVVSIAVKYQNLGLPLMDLINEGNMGLIRAVDKFDVEKGFKFISYARWWIRHYILKAIFEQSTSIKLPLKYATHLSN
jgi:RNA polymerase primary sigma factor